MKYIFTAAALTLFVLVGAYFLFAFQEGERKSIWQTETEQKTQFSQGLSQGRYAVFYTLNDLSSGQQQYQLWRLPEGGEAEKFYEFTFVSSENSPPRADIFSRESVSLKWPEQENSQNILIHINGEKIGPTEDEAAFISPNRDWVALGTKVNLATEEKARMIIKNVPLDERLDITPPADSQAVTNFIPIGWSKNSRQAYWQGQGESQSLWGFDVLLREVIQIPEINNFNFTEFDLYPNLGKVIGVYSTDDNTSRVYLRDLFSTSSQILFAHSQQRPKNVRLSDDGNYFIYNLGEKNNIWQGEIKNPQAKNIDIISQGKIWDYLSLNRVLYERDQILWRYDLVLEKEERVFDFLQSKSSQYGFIGLFDIK